MKRICDDFFMLTEILRVSELAEKMGINEDDLLL